MKFLKFKAVYVLIFVLVSVFATMAFAADKALDEANAKGWMVVDMKKDWKVIYPFEK